MIRSLLIIALLLLSNLVTRAADEKTAEPSAEVRAFAQQLVRIAEQQDRQALADLIDFERLLEQSVLAKCEYTSEHAKKEFNKGFLRASREIEKAFYKKYLPDHKLVSLLQIKPLTDREWLVTLRYFLKDYSDYMVFRVEVDAHKSFKIIDLSNGSDVSSFTSSLELTVLAMHQAPIIKTLGSYEPLRDWLVKNQELYTEFTRACGTHDFETVIKLYSQLPTAIQKFRLVEYNYYRANALVEKPVLTHEALQAYYAKHRDPGTLQLVSAYGRSQGSVDALLATYDEFDRLLGKDPLNNLHRAMTFVDAEKFDKAYACARQLIQDYPDWKRSYITLMVVALFDKDYKLTLQQLQILRDKFQVNLFEHVEMNDDYKDFRKSPEYAIWKKENGAAVGQDKQ